MHLSVQGIVTATQGTIKAMAVCGRQLRTRLGQRGHRGRGGASRGAKGLEVHTILTIPPEERAVVQQSKPFGLVYHANLSHLFTIAVWNPVRKNPSVVKNGGEIKVQIARLSCGRIK